MKAGTLFIIEPEHSFQQQLKSLFSSQFHIEFLSSDADDLSRIQVPENSVALISLKDSSDQSQMPVQKMRTHAPQMRIVLLTPEDDLQTYARALSMKCFECVQKSSRPEDIHRAVADAFNQPQTQQERTARPSSLVTTAPGKLVQTDDEKELRACFHNIANSVAAATGFTERSIKTIKNSALESPKKEELLGHLDSVIKSLDTILEYRENYRNYINSKKTQS